MCRHSFGVDAAGCVLLVWMMRLHAAALQTLDMTLMVSAQGANHTCNCCQRDVVAVPRHLRVYP